MAYIFPKIKGKINDYDIIVIGHLSWNRYFGEGPDAPVRGMPFTCNSVLIRGMDLNEKPYNLLIDPTLRHNKEEYYFDLNRRTGLKPEDITHCFITHYHMDHVAGTNYFPQAKWVSASETIEYLKNSPDIDYKKIIPVKEEFLPGIYVLPLYGHTLHLNGIAFNHNGHKIVVASDAIMTKNHFLNNTTEFEVNTALAAKTIQDIKESFDIAIPGHDNLIIVNTK
jgi:glyoxylase-like metal-dependent hydrolase (beta-lactamase superfamily II)